MIVYDIIAGIILVLATEAVTEIIVASEFPLFYWFREWWTKYAFPPDGPPRTGILQYVYAAIHKLITCGYCMSVWVAAFFALWTPFNYFDNTYINWMISLFCIHRLSNWLHIAFEIFKRGRVKSHDIELRIGGNEEDV